MKKLTLKELNELNKLNSLNKLLKVIELLRHPENGCPWDISQTFETLSNFPIEEAYELQNAVNNKDNKNIKEELGDLLFTLQCYAEIKNYNLNNILSTSNYKFEKRFSKLKEIAEFENITLNKASSKTKEQLWKKAKKKVKLP